MVDSLSHLDDLLVIQNRTMVIGRLFYFDGIKAKKGASFQAKLLIGHGKQNDTFYRSQ